MASHNRWAHIRCIFSIRFPDAAIETRVMTTTPAEFFASAEHRMDDCVNEAEIMEHGRDNRFEYEIDVDAAKYNVTLTISCISDDKTRTKKTNEGIAWWQTTGFFIIKNHFIATVQRPMPELKLKIEVYDERNANVNVGSTYVNGSIYTNALKSYTTDVYDQENSHNNNPYDQRVENIQALECPEYQFKNQFNQFNDNSFAGDEYNLPSSLTTPRSVGGQQSTFATSPTRESMARKYEELRMENETLRLRLLVAEMVANTASKVK